MTTAWILPVAKEAKIAVVVVPMLAPIVMGNAASMVRIPAATRGTNNDVVTELLWTITVKIKPAKKPNNLLLVITLSRIISALFIVKDFMTRTRKKRHKNNIVLKVRRDGGGVYNSSR